MQKDLDRTLQSIGHVQDSLLDEDNGILVNLESRVDVLFEGIYSSTDGKNGTMMTVDDADIEREKAYSMAIECQNRLNAIERSANELEEEISEMQGDCFKNGAGSDDASESNGEVATIVERMNQHHDILRSLDQTCRKMEKDLRLIDQTVGQN